MSNAVEVEPLTGYRIRVRFDDGVEGVVDLSHLAGRGVFRLWEEEGGFERAHVGPVGEVEWTDEVAICPDALYLTVTGKSVEDLFPNLKGISLGA